MDALEWWGVRTAGQTVVCLALGVGFAARLRATPARAHAVLLLALAAALATPAASWAVKRVNGGAFIGPPPPTVYRLADEPEPVSGTPRWPLEYLLVAVWGVSSVLLLAGLGVSYVRGRRLVARAEPVHDERLLGALAAARAALALARAPVLRCSAEVSAPAVWCWGRVPVVLIPADAPARAAEIDWAAVFVHELAHVRRNDHRTALFADAVSAVLFWNPVVWVVRRQLARTSEFACDDRVIGAGRSPVEFAHALLALRRSALLPRIPVQALSRGGAGLKARVRRLLQPSGRSVGVGRGWVLSAFLVTAFIVLGLALAQPRLGPRPEAASTPLCPESGACAPES